MVSSSPLTIDPKNPQKLESQGNFVSSSCGKITPNFYQLAVTKGNYSSLLAAETLPKKT